MTQYLSTKQLCELYGVSKQAVEQWRKNKGLPYEKLSYKTIRYDINEVKKWIANNKKGRV